MNYKSLKKIILAFDKISLLFQTVLESEARSVLPTVQMDLSWTLQMSDQQNDWSARPLDSLRSSLTTKCTSWKYFHRKVYANGSIFKLFIQKDFIVF